MPGTRFRSPRKFEDTRAIELQIGPIDKPILHSPSAVSMGNPHAIFWVDDVDAYDLGKIGPLLEHHPMFPERANISLAQVVSREHIVLRTWERGAGLTRACGSAACAAAVAAARLRRTDRKVTVTLPGGDLVIEWRERDDHVLMTGPVAYEYEGRFDPALFAKRERRRVGKGANCHSAMRTVSRAFAHASVSSARSSSTRGHGASAFAGQGTHLGPRLCPPDIASPLLEARR